MITHHLTGRYGAVTSVAARSLLKSQGLGSVKRIETIVLFWRYINKTDLIKVIFAGITQAAFTEEPRTR